MGMIDGLMMGHISFRGCFLALVGLDNLTIMPDILCYLFVVLRLCIYYPS